LLGGPALGLRLIVLALMSVGLMVADHRQHNLSRVRDWLSAAAYPFQWTVQSPLAAWIAARESFATRSHLEADNVRLAADNFLLRLKMMRFEALEQENRRLRAAGESTSRVVQRTLIAEIVRVDLDPFRQRVLVNKGSRNGVFRGQAVLDANGVFGQVVRAGPVSAEVILISDPEHAIPVQINRTGTRSIALGTGRTGMLSLPYLPQNADVVDGDLLVSSGLGGVYPPGYPVGKVTSVVRDPSQPLLAIEAAPLAGLDRDPEILLVWFDNAVVEPEAEAEDDAEPKPVPEPKPVAPPAAAPPAEPPPAAAPPIEAPPIEAPPIEAPPDEAPPDEAPPIEAPPDEAPPDEAPPVAEPPIAEPAPPPAEF
jgi:rod shape-determining protein MreC